MDNNRREKVKKELRLTLLTSLIGMDFDVTADSLYYELDGTVNVYFNSASSVEGANSAIPLKNIILEKDLMDSLLELHTSIDVVEFYNSYLYDKIKLSILENQKQIGAPSKDVQSVLSDMPTSISTDPRVRD